MLASNQEKIRVLNYLRRTKLETDKDFEVQLQKFTVKTSLLPNHNLEPEKKKIVKKAPTNPNVKSLKNQKIRKVFT